MTYLVSDNSDHASRLKAFLRLVFDYLTLEKVTNELRSQIIVIDIDIEELSSSTSPYEITRILFFDTSFYQI